MKSVIARHRWIVVALIVGLSGAMAGRALGTEAESPSDAPEGAATSTAETGRPSGLGPFLRTSYQIGSVLQSSAFVKGDYPGGTPIDTYHALRLEFGWQTDGSSPWHHAFNFPAYGFGLYGADFFNDEQLGKPTALYGFFTWPLKRWTRLQFNTEIGFGLTEDWKPYDPETNPYNLAMGGARSVYIDAGFTLDYRLSKQLDLLGGFTFTHFSNGSSREPNWGINLVGPYALVRYNVRRGRPVFPERVTPPYERQWEMFVYGAGSPTQARFDTNRPEQIEKYHDQFYFVGNLTATFARQMGHKFKTGIGLDYWYDASTDPRKEIGEGLDSVEFGFAERSNLGVHYLIEVVANRVSAPMVVGYTLVQEDFRGQYPRFYQKAGIKWHMWQNTFVGMNVRAVEFSRAIFLEWCLGHRWRWG